MTFEGILDGLTFNSLTPQEAYDMIKSKDKMKSINYYIHFNDISKEPLSTSKLQELNAIVNILQILYNSEVDSPISDSDYDTLQEILIDMGIPRLTGTIEINSDEKVKHKYTMLRGTLDKVYYLDPNEKRVNKSRKSLDEWIKSTESLYERKTGKRIDLNSVKIILTAKYDGMSSTLEIDNKFRWITRGDTTNNLASDVTHILDVFNGLYSNEPIGTGVKFEIMVSEENRDRINELCRAKPYKNSRQIVTATLNLNEPDFKVDYLYPVPLRIIHDGDDVESIHPDMIRDFPTEICTFGDRDKIREFANRNRYVNHNGMRFRTDGVVMTILDKDIQRVLGRENNINNFEVAYKFTEEYAYTKVKNIQFDVSDFGYLCPVLVVNDVILKGNTINHISLSNKERFDELDLCYGDEVKVLYDIIPYVTIDENCRRIKNGRKVEFIRECPRCHEPLDLNTIQVRCKNKNCPSRILGRIQNYCTNLRIQHIGYSTLETLYAVGLLDDGIISLYKLRKHFNEIQGIEGFGKIKTKKIINEIESKRKLNDYDFFGSIGIDGMSTKTFRLIFSNIKLSEFMDMIKLKNFDLLKTRLTAISGIGTAKASELIKFIQDDSQWKEIQKLIKKELSIHESYGETQYNNGRVTFSGCRPTDDIIDILKRYGYDATYSWSDKSTKYLVIPKDGYTSSKVASAINKNVPIIPINGRDLINVLREYIPEINE